MESVNEKDRHGHTPLISASKEGLKDFVQDLLHRGAGLQPEQCVGIGHLGYRGSA